MQLLLSEGAEGGDAGIVPTGPAGTSRQGATPPRILPALQARGLCAKAGGMSEQRPQPPAGWTLREGGGGWSCVQPEKRWSTNVYLEKAGGAAKAVEAAIELERKAIARLEEIERECAALRRCFRG